MDIEGEAECAAVIQGVTARGEQGPAVDENVGLGNQSDSPLLSDEGEPTDDQDQRLQVGWGLRETSCCLDLTGRGLS